ncbi:hypothetical protein BGX26_008728 [Mortierella sp. AD094]|nr:hypothetical protein BGX26_008728 [Mortierella sp. AD094]
MDPKDTSTTSVAKATSCQNPQKPLHSALSDPANPRRQSSFTVRFAESALSPAPKSPLRPSTPKPKLTGFEGFDYLPEIFDFKLLDDMHQDDNTEINFSSRLTEKEYWDPAPMVEPTSEVTGDEGYGLGTSDLLECDESPLEGEEGVTEESENLRHVDNLHETDPIINVIDSSPEESGHDVTPESISPASSPEGQHDHPCLDPTIGSRKSGKHFSLASTVLSEFLLRTPSSVASSTPQSAEMSPAATCWLPSPPLPMPIFANTPRSTRSISFAASKIPKLHHLDAKRKIAAPRLFRPSSLRFTTTQESPLHSLELLSSTTNDGSEAGPSTPPGSSTTFGGFTTPNTERSEDDKIVEDSEDDEDTGSESVRDSVYSEVYYSANNEDVDLQEDKGRIKTQ